MRCGNCGAESPNHSMYCGWCGAELSREPGPGKDGATATPPGETAAPGGTPSSGMVPEMRYCTHCGKSISVNSEWCAFCGKRPWATPPRTWDESAPYHDDYPHSAEAFRTSTTSGLTVGGVLAIVAGILALIQGIIFAMGSTMSLLGAGYLCFCGGIEVLFGIVSILGGSCALKSENFSLALVGAILGMLAFGLGVGFLLGLIAVIFIAMSRNEFG